MMKSSNMATGFRGIKNVEVPFGGQRYKGYEAREGLA